MHDLWPVAKQRRINNIQTVTKFFQFLYFCSFHRLSVYLAMAEPTQLDLLEAVKESLHKDGRLEKFKAELRSAVMSILSKNASEEEPPKVPEETKFINELIREYLSWNGYLYTEQILAAECGQNMERLSRDVLTTKLGVMDDSRTAKIPLLYYIVSAFQNHETEES